MAYRLYTKDVARGYTDFNDDHMHLLTHGFGDENAEDTIGLIFDAEYEIFQVVHYLDFHVLNSISYMVEEESSDFDDMLETFAKAKHWDIAPDQRPKFMDDLDDEEELEDTNDEGDEYEDE